MGTILAAALLIAVAAGSGSAQPQDLLPQETHATLLLTPDPSFNRRIQGKDIRTVPEYGFDDSGERIRFSPEIPPHWTWLAALHVPTKGERRNFFFYDGWLFTTVEMSSGRRRQMYERDATPFVRSNAIHAAFHRRKGIEEEVVILVVSPIRQRVRLELDSVFFGRRQVLEYPMGELEAKFINVTKVPEEFTVVPWSPERGLRTVIPLDTGWRFHKGEAAGAQDPASSDASWEMIDIPHTWNDRDVYDTRNLRDSLDIMAMYYRGAGWYRKTFVPDGALREKQLQLHFLGANQVADVWVNGVHLSRHVGGYLGFAVDITGRVAFDRPNLLAVRVDNAYNYDIPPHTGDFNFYGGLYREVELLALPVVSLDDVHLQTPTVTFSSADVIATVRIRNSSPARQTLRLVTNIVSPANEIVRSAWDTVAVPARSAGEKRLRLPDLRNPLLWAPDHPWLYTVYTTLTALDGTALDQTVEPLGFRWYSFDPDSGFSLNGERCKLRGVNLHQDALNAGNAVGVDRKREDLLHIKRMGANFVRLAHYPHHPAVLDIADSLGLLLWEEIPHVNTIGRGAYMENTKRMLADMIGRDKNHPSVILWGLGNEFAMPWLADEDKRLSMALLRELHAIAKKLDPSRLTVQAHNEIIDTAMLGVTDVQGRNRYFGWYEGSFNDLGPALDAEKRLFPRWNVLVSEYGAEGKYGYHVETPALFDHSETYQLAFHEASWKAICERPWVAGGTVWNMFDFGSFRKIGNIPHINQKGMMTADRKPKDVYFFYQSQWSEEPMVHIVSDTWTHRSGREGDVEDIRVLSNCETVELLVNGTSVGSHSRGFRWKVVLTPGTNRLTAVGRKAGETVRHQSVLFYTRKK